MILWSAEGGLVDKLFDAAQFNGFHLEEVATSEKSIEFLFVSRTHKIRKLIDLVSLINFTIIRFFLIDLSYFHFLWSFFFPIFIYSRLPRNPIIFYLLKLDFFSFVLFMTIHLFFHSPYTYRINMLLHRHVL